MSEACPTCGCTDVPLVYRRAIGKGRYVTRHKCARCSRPQTTTVAAKCTACGAQPVSATGRCWSCDASHDQTQLGDVNPYSQSENHP